MNNKNGEYYNDPTAGNALGQIEKQENKELQDKTNRLIKSLKNIIELSGFELLGRIELKHKKSGKNLQII